MTFFRFAFSILAALASFTAAAGVPPKPDVPTAVNDFAGVLTSSQQTELETDLDEFAYRTSNRIVVVTVPDLEGMPSSEYAYEIGESWGVGSGKFDNGVVLLIKPRTEESGGDVFIATGYGLEGAIPDAACSRIASQEMVPFLRDGNYYEGIKAGLDILKKLAAGEITYDEWAGGDDDALFVAIMFFVIIMVIVFIVLKKGRGGNGGQGGGNGGGSDGDKDFWKGVLLGSLLNGDRSPHRHGGFGGGSFGGDSGGFGGGFSGGFGGGHFGGGGGGAKF